MARFLAWVKTDAPLILYGVQAVLAVAVAFGFHASPGWVAGINTAAAGAVTILTALATRPVRVPVITGAVAAIGTAAAAFGLHLSGDQIGAADFALAITLGLLLRQNVTPALTPAAKPPAQA